MSIFYRLQNDIESIKKKIENASEDIADDTISFLRAQQKALETQCEGMQMRDALEHDIEDLISRGRSRLMLTEDSLNDIANSIIKIQNEIHDAFNGESEKAIQKGLSNEVIYIGMNCRYMESDLLSTLKANVGLLDLL
jgi:hypothetical protein